MLAVIYKQVSDEIGEVIGYSTNCEDEKMPHVLLEDYPYDVGLDIVDINLKTKELIHRGRVQIEEDSLEKKVELLEQLVADLASLQLGV